MTLPTPLQVRDWIRLNLPVIGVERVASELEKLSEKCASIGAPDITLSFLVTSEMTRHLRPPPGWDAEHVEMWRRLPYAVARYVSEKRLADIKAVKKCLQLEAELKKRKKLGS